MGARLVDALVKRGIGAFQRIHGESAEHIGGVREYVRLQSGQQSDRQHALGAIDERDRLFGLQRQWLDVSLRQGFRSRQALAAEGGFASAISTSARCASGARSPLAPTL